MAESYAARMIAMSGRYQQGENINAFRERMKAQFDEIQPDVSKMENLSDPDLRQFVIQDDQERRRRAELSSEMRSKLIDAYTTSVGRQPFELIQPLGRARQAVRYYYTMTGQPEKIKEFEELFLKPDPDAEKFRMRPWGDGWDDEESAREDFERERERLAYRRGKMLADMIEPFRNMRPADCTNMSDEYVKEHFAELYFIHELTMNMEESLQGKNSYVRYSPEDYERAKFSMELYAPLGTCLSQAYEMANPYYAVFDAERCVTELEDSFEKCFMLGTTDHTEFGDMFTDTSAGAFSKRGGGVYAITEQLRMYGIDPKKAKFETQDGQTLDINSLEGHNYTFAGKPIYVTAGENHLLIHAVPPQAGGEWSVQTDEHMENAFNAGYTEAIADLFKTVDEADPFYIRSSQQFRTMKNTLSELTKLGAMNESENTMRADENGEIADKVRQLEENCRSYLEFKGTEGKNDLERRRIAAVQKVLSFAQDKVNLLNKADETQRTLNAVGRTQESSFEVKFLKQGLAYADIPARGNARLEAVNNGIRQAFNVERDKACDCIDLHKGAPGNWLEGEQLETAKNMVALLTIKAMIVNDQAGREPNNSGPINNVFNQVTVEKFKDFVATRPLFQDTMNNMTREKLYKFVTEGGAQTLARNIITAIVEKGREQSMPSAQAHMEKIGPEAQKKQGGPSM